MHRRVLFLAPVPFFKGGAETSLFDLLRNPSIEPVLAVPENGDLARAARAEGVHVEVVSFGEVSRIRRPFQFRSVVGVLFDWFRAARMLANISRECGVIAVHSNGLKAHAVAVLARLFGGAPVVAHVRDIPLTRAECLVWRLLALGCRRMVLVSRSCWPSSSVMLPSSVVVVHNGIHVGTEEPRTLDRSRPLTLGFCGRIHPSKGLEILLTWMKVVVNSGIDARLIVRGVDAAGDGDYFLKIMDIIRREFPSGEVIYDGKKASLVDIYSGIDVVVVPSDIPDPLPRSAMEAMSIGLPVIGWPAGGIPDMVRPGETGWLVDKEDDFLATVRSVIGDVGLYERLSGCCLDVARREFSLDALHANISNIYEECTERVIA